MEIIPYEDSNLDFLNARQNCFKCVLLYNISSNINYDVATEHTQIWAAWCLPLCTSWPL